jgi:hypothetical protein
MVKQKYDGVVEAVRYGPEGQVSMVRIYERRGAVFSDRVLLTREELVQRLKGGQQYVLGNRIPQMGGSFDISVSVRLVGSPGDEVLITNQQAGVGDNLEGAPEF